MSELLRHERSDVDVVIDDQQRQLLAGDGTGRGFRNNRLALGRRHFSLTFGDRWRPVCRVSARLAWRLQDEKHRRRFLPDLADTGWLQPLGDDPGPIAVMLSAKITPTQAKAGSKGTP